MTSSLDHFLVTGGTGFLGSALVRRLVQEGKRVRVLDNNSRGVAARLSDVASKIELFEGDIRDPEAVKRASRGIQVMCHLAFVNGTEFFYSRPDLVLDVGVRGMINVLDACKSEGVPELILVSSSEVYQAPPVIPTDESAPLSIPDVLNPRFSYAAGKLISEILALHGVKDHFKRVSIFRPHNVYGPDMGWEHVVPQLILRMHSLLQSAPATGSIDFPIQGSGQETRAFVFVDDFTEGLWKGISKGLDRQIYHIGVQEEVSIADLSHQIAALFGRTIVLRPGALAAGSTSRRCPDISKLKALGYAPKFSLKDGLSRTIPWYRDNAHLSPKKA